jgi:hypothetical protein
MITTRVLSHVTTTVMLIPEFKGYSKDTSMALNMDEMHFHWKNGVDNLLAD